MAERLNAFPVLEVDVVQVWVDQRRPIAVLQRPEELDQTVTWPDLFTGWTEPTTTVVAAPHGVWVHYSLLNGVADDDPLAPYVNQVDAPVVHIDTTTGIFTVIRVGQDQVLGATGHGLWTTSRISHDPDPDVPYLGGPLPPDWHDDTLITVHHPDGTTASITVDRDVLAVRQTGQQVRLLVRPSPAVATPEGGGWRYEYRQTELRLPIDQPLPGRVRFRELVPDGWGTPADLGHAHPDWPQRATTTSPTSEQAPSVDGSWTLVELPEHLQELAVEFTTTQFENLEHYWCPEDDGPAQPLSDGLHDPAVTISGDYPHTHVDVSFRHPAHPDGRLQRTYPLYDHAGRIRIDTHLAIWLMEDLDTGDIPPAAAAIDGVLHI